MNKTRYRRKVVFTVAVMALSQGLMACHKAPDGGSLRASGTLELRESVLSVPSGGRIATVSVDEGDIVKQGQMLATLTRYEQAQRDLERLRRLLPEGGATRESVERAILALDDQGIRAPSDGMVLMRVSEPGEVVGPGTAILVIGNPAKVYLKLFIPENIVGRIKLGDPAKVYVDSFPQRPFEGKVTFISPQAEFTPKNIQTPEERVTMMFEVKVTLDAPAGLAKPGLPADCEIQVNAS